MRVFIPPRDSVAAIEKRIHKHLVFRKGTIIK